MSNSAAEPTPPAIDLTPAEAELPPGAEPGDDIWDYQCRACQESGTSVGIPTSALCPLCGSAAITQSRRA